MTIFLQTPLFRFLTYSQNYTFRRFKHNLNDILIKMPKELKHVAAIQKQRQKIKESMNKYSPGRVTLQVLGTGAKGAPKSLYVFSDQSRYLFNCGEGTQRLAHELKLKLAKLEHIFITQSTWRNIGGLPGTALTIQDVGVPQITLHGPQGLEEIFVGTKRFVILKDLSIRMAECKEDILFEDNVLKVRYVPLTKPEVDGITLDNSHSTDNTSDDFDKRVKFAEIAEDDTDYYAHERSGKKGAKIIDGRTNEKFVITPTELLEMRNRAVAMAYICQLQPRPGALCLEKCVEAGVPPGPLLGKLKSGVDVVLADGTVVKSKDVCLPDDPGPIFIVVDCPSEKYLDSLVYNPEFKKHQKFAKKDDDVASVVVHFTESDVMEHPKYQEWMNNFVPSTQHLILNETNTCMGSLSVHRIQYKLNLLNKDIFPLLGDCGTQFADDEIEEDQQCKKLKLSESSSTLPNSTSSSRTSSSSVLSNTSWISANTLCSVHLRPKKGLDRSEEIKLKPSEYIRETLVVENFQETLQEIKPKLEKELKQMSNAQCPKLLFLGTGSCIPNKTRNTSGILLEISENHNILMDCGEGTYGQLVRFFGRNEVDRILVNIHAIYISHLHADHHIGLIGLLQGRKRALAKLKRPHQPVYLFAPVQILSWLNFYDRCFESVCNEFILKPNRELIYTDRDFKLPEHILNKLNIKNIETCPVRHCPNAFGVAITLDNGCKITYSGDTMPSPDLIKLGENSDLLIHEATMEDELAQEAVIKMHSTTSQAIEVGNQMKAKYTLLTHFSQRYAKLPRFNDNFKENVGIAFDNMQVRLDDLKLIPHYYPALKLMFLEHYEDLDHRALKRQLKIERQKLT